MAQRSLHFDGPDYKPTLDRARLSGQHERIREYMLGHGCWRTLREIADALDYPEASVSAQLRHLRKPRFGSYRVDRRRGGARWEYRVRRGEPCGGK